MLGGLSSCRGLGVEVETTVCPQPTARVTMGVQGQRVQGVGCRVQGVQGYLAHKKQPPPIGAPYSPRHSRTAGSQGFAVFMSKGLSSCRGLGVWEEVTGCPQPAARVTRGVQGAGCRVQGVRCRR
jgi:hypothetical protein